MHFLSSHEQFLVLSPLLGMANESFPLNLILSLFKEFFHCWKNYQVSFITLLV